MNDERTPCAFQQIEGSVRCIDEDTMKRKNVAGDRLGRVRSFLVIVQPNSISLSRKRAKEASIYGCLHSHHQRNHSPLAQHCPARIRDAPSRRGHIHPTGDDRRLSRLAYPPSFCALLERCPGYGSLIPAFEAQPREHLVEGGRCRRSQILLLPRFSSRSSFRHRPLLCSSVR